MSGDFLITHPLIGNDVLNERASYTLAGSIECFGEVGRAG